MKFFAPLLGLLAAALSPADAVKGVDVSQKCLPSGWKCLKEDGFSFAVVRAWQQSDVPDPNSPHTIYNAWDGGMSHVDVYLFPCYGCHKSATTQVEDMVNNLKSYSATYGMIWLDIEGAQYWGSSKAENCNFIREMAAKATSMGKKVGIYSSASQWGPICDSHDFSSYPIWYAHYDNNPSFSDFSPFGGWTTPAVKQYAGDVSKCSCGIDENYYPPGFLEWRKSYIGIDERAEFEANREAFAAALGIAPASGEGAIAHK